MLIDPEPMLPTRGYRVLCHDATLIVLKAESMWPMGTQLEFTVTTLVIGLPRQVLVQRCRCANVDLVLRDDGAVWPPVGPANRVGASGASVAHRVRSSVPVGPQRLWEPLLTLPRLTGKRY